MHPSASGPLRRVSRERIISGRRLRNRVSPSIGGATMYRKACAIATLCVAVGVVRLAAADDQADARAIVAKAIKAVGGEQKLEKFKAQTWREVGTYYGMGDGLPYTGNYAV